MFTITKFPLVRLFRCVRSGFSCCSNYEDQDLPQYSSGIGDVQRYLQFVKTNTTLLQNIKYQHLQDVCEGLRNDQIQWRQVWIKKICKPDNPNQKPKTVFYADEAQVRGLTVHRRINDFPQQPFYTVVLNDYSLFHFNSNPKNWKVIRRK